MCLCVICVQLWQGRWQGDEIIVKVLQVRDWTTRKSRDFNEEHPKLRYVSQQSHLGTFFTTLGIMFHFSFWQQMQPTNRWHLTGNVVKYCRFLQLSSADEDFHTCYGTFCNVFLGFFRIQTFCLFLGPVSHLHHLTLSSLLTTCHTDRSSTYSTKALVSRFMFVENSNPVFTLYSHFSFAVPLFGTGRAIMTYTVVYQ